MNLPPWMQPPMGKGEALKKYAVVKEVHRSMRSNFE